ncbi:MAG: hypothetical protein DWH97_05915 [Planctomycetota bacterium]|nr:MAG: hypothetical protein DWH97_05915 [Planctomycetota bacterium]
MFSARKQREFWVTVGYSDCCDVWLPQEGDGASRVRRRPCRQYTARSSDGAIARLWLFYWGMQRFEGSAATRFMARGAAFSAVHDGS